MSPLARSHLNYLKDNYHWLTCVSGIFHRARANLKTAAAPAHCTQQWVTPPALSVIHRLMNSMDLTNISGDSDDERNSLNEMSKNADSFIRRMIHCFRTPVPHKCITHGLGARVGSGAFSRLWITVRAGDNPSERFRWEWQYQRYYWRY